MNIKNLNDPKKKKNKNYQWYNIIPFHDVELKIRFSRDTPLSTAKSSTKSLNWPWLNELVRNIEHTSFALLT